MSQWTHVSGSFNLEVSPYILTKSAKSGRETVSLLDDEMVLGTPEARTDDGLIYLTAYLYSLPRAKMCIDKWMSELMPYGETGFTYYLNQRKDTFDMSSSFYHKCEEKLFEKKLKEMFVNDPNHYYAENILEKFGCETVETNEEVTLTVSDDIRCCSGVKLMRAFEKLINNMNKEFFHIRRCAVEWTDEYNGDVIFSVRRLDDADELIFSIINKSNRKIVAKKTMSWDFNTETVDVKTTENWDTLETLYPEV